MFQKSKSFASTLVLLIASVGGALQYASPAQAERPFFNGCSPCGNCHAEYGGIGHRGDQMELCLFCCVPV